MKTYGDFFTGFGGMTIGAIAAGLDVLFGVEYDAKIAEVYRQNLGNHIMVADLLKIDVSKLPRVDVFHASPPCPNFSQAKTGGEETANDIALSAKVAEYIAYHLPDVFTLENVYQYRNSKSWQAIASALLYNGYQFNYWHVNLADYGVPQTRQRMIVIARRDGVMPQLPPATHAENPQAGLFGTMKRWVSWYEAIEDLIPTFKTRGNSKKLDRVNFPCSLIQITNANQERGKLYRADFEPSWTIVAGQSLAYRDRVGAIFSIPLSAVARFQSFPDRYKLSQKSIAGRGIGNAVPPLFAEKLYRHLVNR